MFKLIPRVRVNYTFKDIIRSTFTGRKCGRICERLRREICKYFGVGDVLLTSSGRGSIYMLLKYLPQTKVIIPAYTCKVVVEAALLAGKNVIFAPTSRKTFNISSLPPLDNNSIVIATHQYGLPCNIAEIVSACKKIGAVVIEDCAGSLGTRINGKLTGLFGDFAVFSFDSSKLINVPSKGGFIIAKDYHKLKDIEQINEIKACSFGYKFKHLTRGLIYILLKSGKIYRCFHFLTMDHRGRMQLDDHVKINVTLGEFYTHGFYDWQATIALRQFKHIDDLLIRRQQIYKYFDTNIKNDRLEKPAYFNNAACIRYAVLTKNKKEFYKKCVKHGVDLGFSFNSVACPPEWKEAQLISEDILNIPDYHNLSDKECQTIVTVVNSIKSW